MQDLRPLSQSIPCSANLRCVPFTFYCHFGCLAIAYPFTLYTPSLCQKSCFPPSDATRKARYLQVHSHHCVCGRFWQDLLLPLPQHLVISLFPQAFIYHANALTCQKMSFLVSLNCTAPLTCVVPNLHRPLSTVSGKAAAVPQPPPTNDTIQRLLSGQSPTPLSDQCRRDKAGNCFACTLY